MNDIYLKIEGIKHDFDHPVLKGVDLQVYKDEVVCLFGKNGCGKTTLLRLIAGFEKVQEGEIFISDKCVGSKSTHKKPYDRQVGLVYQNLALFPHLTVEENILFGLKKWNQKYRKEKLESILNIFKLGKQRGKYSSELSGGEKQRLAIARSLAAEPQFLMLDEPFSQLDVNLRCELACELKAILKEKKIPTLFVTHQIEEAQALSDRAVILSEGKITHSLSRRQITRGQIRELVK